MSTVLVAIAIVAAPAAVLRVLCIGPSCDKETQATARTPFCSLPPAVRAGIAAGYREGRSPDVLGVTRAGVKLVSEGVDRIGAAWPSVDAPPTSDIPLVFVGDGIASGIELDRVGLDDVSPTLAEVIGFDIPHPDVRSGRPMPGVATGDPPGLIVVAVLRQVRDASTDPVLNALAGRGAATMTASDLSLPADDAALITNVGTGGLPSEHGITGTTLRNEEARAAKAWNLSAPRGPRSVIATLADDLDEKMRGRPKIGLVADTFETRGLIGGNWYIDHDRDELRLVSSSRVVDTVADLIAEGFGADTVPDVIGVSMRTQRDEGAAPALDLFRVVQRARRGAALAVVALPATGSDSPSVPADDLISFVERELGTGIVEADTAGGLFLDQKKLAGAQISKTEVVDVMRGFESAGEAVFADVFPGLAVSFARFC